MHKPPPYNHNLSKYLYKLNRCTVALGVKIQHIGKQNFRQRNGILENDT